MECQAGDHFQTVILQCVQLVTGTKNICALIDYRLTYFDLGAFDKLVCDSYTAVTGYLGRDCGTQNAEQRHLTFLNRALRRKLNEKIRFFCKRETGGVLNPEKNYWKEQTLSTKPPHQSWRENTFLKQPPTRSTLKVHTKTPIFSPKNIMEDAVKSVA